MVVAWSRCWWPVDGSLSRLVSRTRRWTEDDWTPIGRGRRRTVGSANDYSVQLIKLQSSVIDDKADINVADLRLQYDNVKTAVAAIQRIGRTPPDDETAWFPDGIDKPRTEMK
eukprot:scaffold10291_cov146-Isochrysis_galbana.AAC.1